MEDLIREGRDDYLKGVHSCKYSGDSKYLEYERGWWYEFGRSDGKLEGIASTKRNYQGRLIQIVLYAIAIICIVISILWKRITH